MENVEKDKEDIIEEEEDAFEVTNDGVLGAWAPLSSNDSGTINPSLNQHPVHLSGIFIFETHHHVSVLQNYVRYSNGLKFGQSLK